MNYKRLILSACFILIGFLNISGQTTYTDQVNLFMGTSGDHGQVSPAAAAPFGMVSVGPDSNPRQHAGYDYAVTETSGISINRMSGVGCSGGGGNLSIKPAAFDKVIHRVPTTEVATPGFYSVTFDNGVKTSLTASERIAIQKFTFEDNAEQSIYINLASTFTKSPSQQHIIISNTEIQGIIRTANTCNKGRYQLAFCLQTDQPFTYKAIDKNRIKLSFINTKTVEVRIGLSSASPLEASKELESISELNFEDIKRQTSEKWEKILSSIEVKGGTQDERVIFYTSLYRTCLSPHEVAAKGQFYRGTDGNMRLADDLSFYSSWSIWDTYRTKFTLLTLIAPEQMEGITRSLLYLYRNGKASWSTEFEPTPNVRTEHTGILLLDCYRRGLTSIDFSIAYNNMKKEIETIEQHSPDQKIELVGDLWALSQIAGILGHKEDEKNYAKSAEDLFESVWKKEFMNITPEFEKMHNNGLYQGTRWQYRWAAPFYIDKMSEWVGKDVLSKQLSYFFDNSLYNQGNEPDIHTPFLFNKLDRPELTQEIVTRLLRDDDMKHIYGGQAEFETPYIGRAFKNTPEGYMYEMDEDDGTMSAWYAFASMGIYPLVIGSDEYELTSPLFDRIVVHQSNGKGFIIETKGRKKHNQKVKKVLLNNVELTKFMITQKDMAAGGTLSFIY